MTISPAPSDERSPLLSNLATNYHDSALLETLPSVSQLPAEVDFPQQEGVNQDLGVVKLDFRLFVSLLYDSVPGKFFFSIGLNA
jgi:hypothetical protein